MSDFWRRFLSLAASAKAKRKVEGVDSMQRRKKEKNKCTLPMYSLFASVLILMPRRKCHCFR